MDAYRDIQTHFSGLPEVGAWPALQEKMARAARGRPGHWQLPLVVCEALCGSPSPALPAAAALACSHIAILLIDDMLDDDPRGDYHHYGQAATANMAAAFQSASLALIAASEIPQEAQYQAVRRLNQAAMTTAIGQHQDVTWQLDENTYWQIVRTKSAPFFGAAFTLGALSAGAGPETAGRMDRLGRLYGEVVQIHDDLNDALETPANPDWTGGRSPLPILFAETVEHPDRARFRQLRAGIQNGSGLEEAQRILVRCGAVSYGVHQVLNRALEAEGLIKKTPLAKPEVMERLLDDLVNPVWALLKVAA